MTNEQELVVYLQKNNFTNLSTKNHFMKRLLFLGVLLMSIFGTNETWSQEWDHGYMPFAQEGNTWEMQVGGVKENVYGCFVDGDTLINGESWKKVYNYRGVPAFSYSYHMAIRDVGQKVYAIAEGSNKPRLLYDFGLKIGDVIKCGIEGNAFECLLDVNEPSDILHGFAFDTSLRLEQIDTIEYRGTKFRCLIFTMLDAYEQCYRNGEEAVRNNVVWVEGVGSCAGPYSPWLPIPPENSIRLVFKNEGNLIFSFSSIYDEMSGGASPVYKTDKNIIPFDLQGRRLNTEPKHGVYIQNGKKVMR